jgi:hypothetical protein
VSVAGRNHTGTGAGSGQGHPGSTTPAGPRLAKHMATRRHRALIEVLLLHRHLTYDHVVAGLAATLQAGAHSPPTRSRWRPARPPRPITPSRSPRPSGSLRLGRVASLTERRLPQRPADGRPSQSVVAYDDLLPSRVAPEAEDGPDCELKTSSVPDRTGL